MNNKEFEKSFTSRRKSGGISSSAFFHRGAWSAILVILALVTIAPSTSAQAQETWDVDSQRSIARLSLGAGSNAVEVGLARVAGDLVFTSDDPANPSVHLTIIGGNGQPADSEEMTFTSRRTARTREGKLVVIGDLSVTRVVRSVTIEANEAYHGPEYGEPIRQTTTEEVRFVVSDPRAPEAQSATVQFSGSAVASREGFPQLLDSVTRDNWPTVLVNDEQCQAPSTIGEDYSGVKCTGTEIASISNQLVSTGEGEGYYGFTPAVTPDRNHATIALDLTLKQASMPSGIAMSAAASAGH